jgi:hypothetical protein
VKIPTSILVSLLLLGGCTPAEPFVGSYAPTSEPLGYPVFVHAEGEHCRYQVQDMIFIRDNQLEDWIGGLSDKAWQIDLVVGDSGGSCLSKALTIVRSAGFSKVLLRRAESLEYPSGLPPG